MNIKRGLKRIWDTLTIFLLIYSTFVFIYNEIVIHYSKLEFCFLECKKLNSWDDLFLYYIVIGICWTLFTVVYKIVSRLSIMLVIVVSWFSSYIIGGFKDDKKKDETDEN